MRRERCGAASVRRGLARGSVDPMRERVCSKVGCAREAVSTLTYDYGDQMAALGPLGAVGDPHAHDPVSYTHLRAPRDS